MGRHSLPDPEDSAGEDQPFESSESQTERFGFTRDESDPDAGFGAPRYRTPQYGDSGYRAPQYRDSSDGSEQPAHFGDDVAEPEHPEPDPGSSGATPPPRGPGRSGPQHSGDWEGGEWTGSHRAVTAGRRGVSVGVIVALVTVVVLVGAVILWRFFGDALSSRSDVAAARCVDGELAVAVIADPSISEQIQALADSYNETAAPVGDRCVEVGVTAAGSDQVVNGFTGTWPAELGERPALWVPASSAAEARLEVGAGAQSVSDSRSLVNSPVLLAVRPQLKPALAQQNWATLPGLQTNPTSLEALNMPGWGSLRLALPLRGDSDASYLAAEAVAAASAPAGAPPSAGTAAVNTLLAGQPQLPDNAASTAMDALLNAPDPASAPVHAVVTTEQQLFQRTSDMPDAAQAVASWLPPGQPAMADYPTVLLSGDWLNQEQVRAASEFARFMRKPDQLVRFAEAGFRTEGGTAPQSDVLDFAPLGEPLSLGDDAARAALADTLTAPARNPAVTIMLDQSMPVDEGGRSRLANVVAALQTRLQALPPTSAVGLWTFDGTAGRSEVSIGSLTDPVDGQPRSAALTAALDAQSASSGGAVSFTTLRLVYTDASANFRAGQSNSVLVITTGPHTDRTLDGQGLQQYIRGAFDPARPVAVNVIDFGSDSDRETWEAVAQTTGGTYQNLESSVAFELNAAIATMLG